MSKATPPKPAPAAKLGEPRSPKPVQPEPMFVLRDCPLGRRGKVLLIDPATARTARAAGHVRKATVAERSIAGV